MSLQASSRDTERFRAAVSQRIGLLFDDAKLGYLGEVLQRRVDKHGRDSASYLWDLENQPSHGEISALARELTVGETYFFRNVEQFRALGEVVLPERACTLPPPKRLRLLSAGCSSGEEPYSMAMVVRETLGDVARTVDIRAVDINPLALEKAKRGRYSSWSLRETPSGARNRWFRSDGREVVLTDAIREMVGFAAANIASDDPELWQPAAYDVVFCRNVLMYFEPMQMRGVIARIARSLAPGGILFLGHAETLRGVSEDFQLCSSHGTFYYRYSGDTRVERSAVTRPSGQTSLPHAKPAEPAFAWFEAIRLASERVAALLPLPEADEADRPEPAPQPFDPASTMRLLREERFAEALDQLRLQSNAGEPSAQVLLLETALLLHSGQTAAASAAASRLLLIDRNNAGAHYLLGLCCEQAGNGGGALEHHRSAAFLDPTFAMPRLHLGLLARRSGDRAAARREMTQARALLAAEDPSRILLFGGGFSREALIALCEAAASDCGDRT